MPTSEKRIAANLAKAFRSIGLTSVNPNDPDGRIIGEKVRMNGQALAALPSPRITSDPAKRSGQACIRGLRITVRDVLEYLADRMSEDEILTEFLDPEREDFAAVYAYAASEFAGARRWGSIHVRSIDLASSLDLSVWAYAEKSGFAILTKDKDFATFANSHEKGPPTVIQIGAGTCSVAKLVDLIIGIVDRITASVQHCETLLEIGFSRDTTA